jgi:hypothetical protein
MARGRGGDPPFLILKKERALCDGRGGWEGLARRGGRTERRQAGNKTESIGKSPLETERKREKRGGMKGREKGRRKGERPEGGREGGREGRPTNARKRVSKSSQSRRSPNRRPTRLILLA